MQLDLNCDAILFGNGGPTMTEHREKTHVGYNRLKDVLDALQGRMGGPKKIHGHARLMTNDRQILQVFIKKVLIPTSSKGGFPQD